MVLVGVFAFVFGAARFFIATGSHAPGFPLVAQPGVAAGFGLFGVAVVWGSSVFTTITVGKGTLRVSGGRGSLPLAQVERAAIVQDKEVGRLRDNMSVWLGPDGVLAPLGQLGQATG